MTPSLAPVPKVPTSLLDFIPLCGKTKPLDHLHDFIAALQAAPRGDARAMCSLPIRHGKSWTVCCAIIFWLLHDPTLRVIVMTHTTEKAKEVAKDIRDLARDWKIDIQTRKRGEDAREGYDTIQSWRTTAGGGVSIKTPGTSRLGADCDIFIWDDPFESQNEADKPEVREQIDADIAFYTNRLSPNGSCIGIMSRFHPDDAIGRRLKRSGWHYIHRRAIEGLGTSEQRALAPDWWPINIIEKRRAEERERDPSERTFFCQWQNEPFAPSTDYLGNPTHYKILPDYPGWVEACGIDMAFTKGRLADWFAIVVIRIYMGNIYIRNAYRFRGDPREAASELHTQLHHYGHLPIFSYVSGPERIAIGMLAQQGIAVQPMQAETNKLWRAQRMIKLWNDGRIKVPENEAWVTPFVERAKTFRGVDGDDDDEVDALVSVVNAMMWGDGAGGTSVLGRRRM